MTTVANRNAKDFHSQPNDVYIGRPSKWGNRYTHLPRYSTKYDGLTHVTSRGESIELYRDYIKEQYDLMKALPELKDKRLVCFCHPLSCHGDILAEMVNALP